MYQGVLLGVEYARMPVHKRCPWQLERIEALLAGVTARHSSFSVCLSPYFDDVRAFQWFHYHAPALGTFAVTLAYTGLLRLDVLGSFEAFLTQVRTVRRQEYRRGLERGFSADASSDIELLDRLHAATFMRQGVERSLEQRTLLLRIAAAALHGGFGELLVCRLPDGRPASATLFLYDDRCAYYLIGANEPEYRQTGSGTFLLVENIKRALGRGLTAVDFVGINSPQRGDFKTSFNAQPTPYYVLSYRGPAADNSAV
jgi:Acetyltransferase (GNAT) domain